MHCVLLQCRKSSTSPLYNSLPANLAGALLVTAVPLLLLLLLTVLLRLWVQAAVLTPWRCCCYWKRNHFRWKRCCYHCCCCCHCWAFSSRCCSRCHSVMAGQQTAAMAVAFAAADAGWSPAGMGLKGALRLRHGQAFCALRVGGDRLKGRLHSKHARTACHSVNNGMQRAHTCSI